MGELMSNVTLHVNGATHTVDIDPSTRLLYVLRNDLADQDADAIRQLFPSVTDRRLEDAFNSLATMEDFELIPEPGSMLVSPDQTQVTIDVGLMVVNYSGTPLFFQQRIHFENTGGSIWKIDSIE